MNLSLTCRSVKVFWFFHYFFFPPPLGHFQLKKWQHAHGFQFLKQRPSLPQGCAVETGRKDGAGLISRETEGPFNAARAELVCGSHEARGKLWFAPPQG